MNQEFKVRSRGSFCQSRVPGFLLQMNQGAERRCVPHGGFRDVVKNPAGELLNKHTPRRLGAVPADMPLVDHAPPGVLTTRRRPPDGDLNSGEPVAPRFPTSRETCGTRDRPKVCGLSPFFSSISFGFMSVRAVSIRYFIHAKKLAPPSRTWIRQCTAPLTSSLCLACEAI
jgi:hypothetical protein